MTRTNSRVRPAGASDVGAIVDLLHCVQLPAGAAGAVAAGDTAADQLARRVSDIVDADRIVLVSEGDDDGIQGVLVARHDEVGAVDLMPVLHVSHLVVATHARRRGVGRALLASAVHLAEQSGVDHVMITAVPGARESNRYLARLGFAPVVTNRVAPTSALHRSLGMAERPSRVAVLQRARRLRALNTRETRRPASGEVG